MGGGREDLRGGLLAAALHLGEVGHRDPGRVGHVLERALLGETLPAQDVSDEVTPQGFPGLPGGGLPGRCRGGAFGHWAGGPRAHGLRAQGDHAGLVRRFVAHRISLDSTAARGRARHSALGGIRLRGLDPATPPGLRLQPSSEIPGSLPEQGRFRATRPLVRHVSSLLGYAQGERAAGGWSAGGRGRICFRFPGTRQPRTIRRTRDNPGRRGRRRAVTFVGEVMHTVVTAVNRSEAQVTEHASGTRTGETPLPGVEEPRPSHRGTRGSCPVSSSTV